MKLYAAIDDTYKDWAPPDVVDRLKHELEHARYQLIALATQIAPDALGRALYDWHGCATEVQFHQWERDAIDKIITAAERDPESKGRAHCPLCKEGTQQWGADSSRGFAVPVGLQGHLLGEGRMDQCSVFKTALRLARDRLQPRFDEDDRRKREAHEARRQTDRVILIDPSKPPELIDDIRAWEGPRNAEQLEWAETRLRTLGFEFDLNGNVMAYRLPHPEFIILADPRETRKITVSIFAGKRHEYFELRDQWTRDIDARFNTMLEDAGKRLCDRLPKPKGRIIRKLSK